MTPHVIICGAFGLIGTNLLRTIPFDATITKIKCDEFPEDLQQADYVIYASGYGQPQMFGKDKIRTIEINTTSLIKAFSYLKEGGTFLYISSSEVYSGGVLSDEESIGTTTPSHPRACYIEGKRCGEAICHSFASQGVKVKIARLALAYGPGTKPHDTRVINQFIEQAIVKRNITLRDGGEAIRTYLYIDDAVNLLWTILVKGKDIVYNVGGFSTLTILELAEEIAKRMNATVTLPDIFPVSDAPASVQLDMSHTLKEFDIHFTPLAIGLNKTIQYQKELYGKKVF